MQESLIKGGVRRDKTTIEDTTTVISGWFVVCFPLRCTYLQRSLRSTTFAAEILDECIPLRLRMFSWNYGKFYQKFFPIPWILLHIGFLVALLLEPYPGQKYVLLPFAAFFFVLFVIETFIYVTVWIPESNIMDLFLFFHLDMDCIPSHNGLMKNIFIKWTNNTEQHDFQTDLTTHLFYSYFSSQTVLDIMLYGNNWPPWAIWGRSKYFFHPGLLSTIFQGLVPWVGTALFWLHQYGLLLQFDIGSTLGGIVGSWIVLFFVLSLVTRSWHASAYEVVANLMFLCIPYVLKAVLLKWGMKRARIALQKKLVR